LSWRAIAQIYVINLRIWRQIVHFFLALQRKRAYRSYKRVLKLENRGISRRYEERTMAALNQTEAQQIKLFGRTLET
jgi:hypothetical protein